MTYIMHCKFVSRIVFLCFYWEFPIEKSFFNTLFILYIFNMFITHLYDMKALLLTN